MRLIVIFLKLNKKKSSEFSKEFPLFSVAVCYEKCKTKHNKVKINFSFQWKHVTYLIINGIYLTLEDVYVILSINKRNGYVIFAPCKNPGVAALGFSFV